MPERMIVAVPSQGAGGMASERSGHFGHCDSFTVVEIDGDTVERVGIVENPPHTENGCLAPVGLLASRGVTAIVAGGMGARPLAGFEAAGITVYFDDASALVGDAVARFLDGRREVMDGRHTCRH